MNNLLKITLLFVMCFGWSSIGEAHSSRPFLWAWQNNKYGLWFTGQYRPRLNFFQNRDFRPSTAGNGAPKDQTFINHRARLGAGFSLGKQVIVLFQLQDVRNWGSETNTLGDFDANGFDMHQAWVQFGLTKELSLKLGRQEFGLDNERLIGVTDWAPQGRAFDGALLNYASQKTQFKLFYARLSQTAGFLEDANLALAWARFTFIPSFQPSIMYILDTNGATNRVRSTVGTHIKGKAGGFQYTGEFYFQFGTETLANTEVAINSFLGAASAGYTFNSSVQPSIKVWAELISGNNDNSIRDNVNRSFNTLFATNHKFYGFTDLFLNLPVHTAGLGLMDFGGRVKLKPMKKMVAFADFHYFRFFDTTGNTEQELGFEINAALKYSVYGKYLSILGVYGVFVPSGGGFNALNKGTTPEHWFIVQTNTSF